jgi:HPr kinase/phosphorylase
VIGGDPAATATELHASAAAWAGRGILLRGPSGAGKSALLARLLAAGAYLVADDLVRLERRGRTLHATAHATAVAGAGLIELRRSGIFRLATTVGVPVSLCVDLGADLGRERLPERRSAEFAGVQVPSLLVGDGRDPAAVAHILVALAARRAH